MKIVIKDNYFIEDDSYCYAIKRSTGKFNNKGSEIVDNFGWYSKLDHAVSQLARLQLIDEYDELTLKDYIDLLYKKVDELEDMVKGKESEPNSQRKLNQKARGPIL